MTREDDRLLTPRRYQEEALEILAKNPSGLLADGLGTGKTLMAVERLDAILKAMKPRRPPRVLVIAPVNTHVQWKRTYMGQFSSLPDEWCRIVGTPESDPESWKLMTRKGPGVFIVGWEVATGMLGHEPVLDCVTGKPLLDFDTCKPLMKPDVKRSRFDLITGEEVRDWPRARMLRVKSKKVFDCQTGEVLRDLDSAKVLTRVDPGGPVLDLLTGEPVVDWSSGKLLKGPKLKVSVLEVNRAMRDGRIPPWNRTGDWDLIVLDESHRAVNRKGLIFTVIRRIKGAHRMACSGTPARNKPELLWSTLNWLWRSEYPAFWDWVKEHFHILEERAGQKIVQVIGPEKDPGKLWDDIPCVVRRKTEDVVAELPGVVIHDSYAAMSPAQLRMYRDFEEQAFAWLDDVPVGTPLGIVQRIRLRQAALGELMATEVDITRQELMTDAHTGRYALKDVEEGGLEISYKDIPQPKILAVKEILEDLPEGEPVLVFTHSSKFADLCVKQLGRRARGWTGKTTQAKRQILKDTFGKDYQVLVAVISAIGEGTDGLQHMANHEIWLSQSEDGMLNTQAEGRLNRPGQSKVVQRWYVRSADTIDEDVYAALEEKLAALRRMYKD